MARHSGSLPRTPRHPGRLPRVSVTMVRCSQRVIERPALAQQVSGPQVIDRIVALVGERPILLSEVDEKIKRLVALAEAGDKFEPARVEPILVDLQRLCPIMADSISVRSGCQAHGLCPEVSL
jgi:hypothetical protein